MAATVPLVTLRRALAREIGRYDTAFTSATPVGPEPARWLIMGHLTSDSTTIRSDGSDPTGWVGGWVQPTSGTASGQTRRIAHVVPEIGAVSVDAPFSAAVLFSQVVDLMHPLPPTRQGGIIGYDDLIVMALRDTWAEDRVSITSVANQRSYALTAQAAWIGYADRITDVYDPPRASGAPRRPTSRRWELRTTAGTPTLDFIDRGYPVSGFSFQLAVRRPCHTLVNGAESSVGPSASTDTVLCEQDEVVEVAKLYAWRWLATWDQVPDEKRAEYAKLAADQEPRVRRLQHFDPREKMTTTEAA